MKKYVLGLAALLLTALPLASQGRAGPSDVFVTTAFGDTLQVLTQRVPKQESTISDSQFVTASWQSKSKTITVTTNRDRYSDGSWEPHSEWAQRHKSAVTAFEKVFPPDPPPPTVGGSADAIGSLPAPGHQAGGTSVLSIWKSGHLHMRHGATMVPRELPEWFAQRVAEGDAALTALFPPS